jgi:hypothetical protein
MKKAAGNDILECGGHQDTAGFIFPDLVSLIQRLQTAIRFSEPALDAAGANRHDANSDFFILDDVTPRCALANAALYTCRARLSEALDDLLEAGISGGPPKIGAHPLSASMLRGSRCGAD